VADHDRGWSCGNCDRRIFVSFLLRVGGIGTKAAAAADVTAPALVSAQIPAAGTTLEITFTEAVSIGAGGNGGFTIALSGGAATLTYASGGGTGTLVYTINRTVAAGETCSDFDYTQPGNGVEDAAGNDLATFSNQQALVTNNSADVTAPTLSSASIPTTGDSLSIVFDETVSIGAGGNGGFTITMSGGAVNLTYSSGSGSNTLVYTTDRVIEAGETCSDFDYTQPGNGVEDAAGNDLATFTNQHASVTNNSTEGDIEVATFSGGGVIYPTYPHMSVLQNVTNGIQNNSFTMDAAAEKVAFIGTIYIDGRPGSAKTISAAGSGKIHFLPGTVTFADTTGSPTNLRVGIQDLDDTTGGSGAGVGATVDGTFDVYADLVAGTDTITTTTWKSATMTTGTKDITHGQKIAVVFDMTVRGGGNTDSVQINGLTVAAGNSGFPQLQHNTASWVRQMSLPICVIEFNDGTLGYLQGSCVHSAVNAVTFASSSTPDEYGIIFQLPFESTAISLWFHGRPTSNAANAELILYSDPTGTPVAEATITLDANNFNLSDGLRLSEFALPTAKTLAANTNYAVCVRPTTTTNVAVMTFSLADANYRKFLAGTNVSRATRSDNAGAFTPTTTEFPLMGVRLG
jgi:hypothetical protein